MLRYMPGVDKDLDYMQEQLDIIANLTKEAGETAVYMKDSTASAQKSSPPGNTLHLVPFLYNCVCILFLFLLLLFLDHFVCYTHLKFLCKAHLFVFVFLSCVLRSLLTQSLFYFRLTLQKVIKYAG